MRGRRAEIVPGGDLTAPLAPPVGLPRELHAEWRTITNDLVERRLLTRSMLGAVDAYVTALWVVKGCRKAISKDGFVALTREKQPKPHPLFGVLAKALEQIARLAGELGLTPASRSRKALQRSADADAGELAERFDV